MGWLKPRVFEAGDMCPCGLRVIQCQRCKWFFCNAPGHASHECPAGKAGEDGPPHCAGCGEVRDGHLSDVEWDFEHALCPPPNPVQKSEAAQ